MVAASTPEWIQAIGSVVAILAAAAAVYLQTRELGAQRRELGLQRQELELQRKELERNVEVQKRLAKIEDLRTYLSLQTQLVRWAHDDPDLRFTGPWGSTDVLLVKRCHYVGMWLNLFQSGFLTEIIDEQALRQAVAGEMFSNVVGCAFWEITGDYWGPQEFRNIVDQEHVIAIENMDDQAEYLDTLKLLSRSRFG